MTHSRRTFLQQATATMAGGWLINRQGPALWAETPNDLLPAPDERFLREAAAVAIDAARAAGASFADIRINASRNAQIGRGYVWSRYAKWPPTWPLVGMHCGYGIRAIVDGSWGFAHDTVCTLDSIAAAARTAVELARINRPRRPRTLELAPVPVVANGEWDTPIERDPYAVPLREQRDVMDAALAPLAQIPLVETGSIRLEWRRMTVVFASTEGSVILQRLTTSLLGGSVSAYSDLTGDDRRNERVGVTTIRNGPYGYEGLGAETLAQGVRDAAERAIEAAKKAALTVVPTEVGRYDLVFAPTAVATLALGTLGAALDLPRALGYEANREGTSYAAPPADMLGQSRTASPLITVTADRTRPKGAATVGWDDEGVKPEACTLVKDGVIVDYLTDRQSAAEIGGWYRSRGEAVRAHGFMRRTGDVLPATVMPNFTVEPAAGTTTSDDLIAGTKRGYYVDQCSGAADQQVLNSQYRARARKIVNGKLGPYVDHCAFQFVTPQFWKSVDGVGGASSSQSMLIETDLVSFTQPYPLSTASAVPMRARQVNVMNVGRTA